MHPAETALARFATLKQRIRAGDPVLGVFVRTPTTSVVETLANAALDFLVLDAEHSPFDVTALDNCILAARASGVTPLVRIPDAVPARILSVLDLGAAGVLIPHVQTAAEASSAAAAARFAGGTRGFSGSHRAAGYGALAPGAFRQQSDDAVMVIAQVEDRAALDNIDAIAAVPELDAVFIGPADLSVSLGADSWDDPVVQKAIDTICGACRRAGRSIGMFLRSAAEVEQYRSKGASLFVIGTDQGLLAGASRANAEAFRKLW